MVDTGASAISLSRSAAMSAQIYCRDQILMRTANGSSSACTAIIPSLEFGPFRLKDVPAIIMPNLDQPLFGMNMLQNFRVEQENGEMRISIRR
jgi:clan AA aspartic protease (TIGR02281 family)